MKLPFSFFRFRSSAGFTLMEMILVLAVIGIFFTMVVPSAAAYTKRARDLGRTTALRTISQALDSYFQEMKKYPPATPEGCISTGALIPKYASTLPQSPSGKTYDEGCGPNGQYGYRVAFDGSAYILIARMENPNIGNLSGSLLGSNTGMLTPELWGTTMNGKKGDGSVYVLREWTPSEGFAATFTSGVYSYSAWGACSVSCGGGVQSRTETCSFSACTVPQATSQSCNTQACVPCVLDGVTVNDGTSGDFILLRVSLMGYLAPL